MPIGLRGVGKTVLLNRFAEIAEQEGYRVGFIEAPETDRFARLLANRLRRILLAMDRGPVSSAVRKALAVLKSFTLTLPDGSAVFVDLDPLVGEADSGNLADDVTDLLVAVGEAARERAQGVLIAIDEVQYLTTEELAAAIVAVHRTTQLNLPVVLVGTGLPQLPGIAGEAKSYAERLFEFPEIGALSRDDARTALIVPAAEQDVTWSDEALGEIVVASSGYPYFLQEWGHHVWNVAADSRIDLDDVEESHTLVKADLDNNFFRVRLDRLTPKEREYLRAMAELGPGPHRSGDIAAELDVRVESIAPRRSALIKKGMVYSPAHGDTAFTVPLFDEFLRRVVPYR